MRYNILPYVAVFLGWFSGNAQILDDSTKQVYGPSTISIVLEDYLKMNQDKKTALDTLLEGIEGFSNLDRTQWLYQDLGNIGTAMYPVYVDLPDQIGRRTGYQAYDRYTVQPESFQYFDTKSPFIDLRVIMGGHGRSLIDMGFTQNIVPTWNFGFSIHRMSIDKQIGAESNQLDRNVENSTFQMFSYYQHPKKPYAMMAYINSFSHHVDETGGLIVADSATDADIFQYRDSPIRLQKAQAGDQRLDFHLYHEYGMFKAFQLYHTLDRNSQVNRYSDFVDQAKVGDFDTYRDNYDRFLVDEDSTYNKATFTGFSNEVGLKGSVSAVFYRVYVRNRRVDQKYLYGKFSNPIHENYLGGITQFRWKEAFTVQAKAEIMHSGEYLLEGNLASSFLNVRYRSMLYHQGMLAQHYFGNHFEWHHDFRPTFANEVDGSLRVKWKGVEIRPNVRFTTLSNYVYFDRDSYPQATGDAVLVSRLGTDVGYFLATNREKQEGMRIKTQSYVAQVTGTDADVFRMPPFLINAKVYWDGKWFKDTVPVQIGASAHGRGAYFANGYEPSTQQFYLQDRYKVGGFVHVDVFLNMQVERVTVFVRATHANMPMESGYFITPLYPGQERVFDLGVRWIFFD